MARKQNARPIETLQPCAFVEVSPSLETLKPEQLAELTSNPEQLANVRAEVVRRLKDDAGRANCLTFRWLMPATDADRADAFDGLRAVCWKEAKYRNRSGLFPRGYPETYCGVRKRDDGSIAQPAGGIAEETREAIKDVLIDYLYAVGAFPPSQVVLRALSGGFHTDVDVANALRRNVYEESKYLFQYGDDVVSKNGEGDSLTLFEVLPDNDPESRTNTYNNLVAIISQEKAQIVEELGEKGWTAWEEILELVDNELVSKAEAGSSQNERDWKRATTAIFERVYGVKGRQACTLKSRFLATIRRIVATVQAKGLPGCDSPPSGPASELSPVVPMELIRGTSRMPVMTYWGDERSSFGRDVPPDEWQKIKARLKDES